MKKFFGRDILDMLSEFTGLALLFLVPVYFGILFPTYNIFELDKLVIFRTGVWLLLCLTMLRVIFYYPFVPFKGDLNIGRLASRYLLVPALFIISLSLVALSSSNLTLSFWGSYARQEGLVNYFFYIAWLVLMIFNILSLNNCFFKKEEPVNLKARIDRNIKRLIITILASSGLVSLYGILQFWGIDFLTWPEPPFITKRTFSSFGQPNFLASWLLLTTPLSFYLVIKNKGLWQKFLPALILALQLVCLLFTASRAAWVALFLSIAIFVLTYLWQKLKLSKGRKIIFSILALLVLFLAALGVNNLSDNRLSGMFKFQSGSVAIRLRFWQISLPAIFEHPVLGHGIENYSQVFLQAYQPHWGADGNVNAYTDRAHNLLLDILLAGGLLGLIAWLILFYFLWRLVKNNIKIGDNVLLNKSLAFALLSYLLSLLFGFSFVSGNVYFFLFLAVLIVLNISYNQTESGHPLWPAFFRIKFKKLTIKNGGGHSFFGTESKKEIRLVSGLAVAAFITWQIIFQVKILIADHYFNALYYNLVDKRYFTAYILDNYLVHTDTSRNNEIYYRQIFANQLSNDWPDIFELSVQKFGLMKLSQAVPVLPDWGYENLLGKAKASAVLQNFNEADKYWQLAGDLGPNLPQTYLDGARIARLKKDWPQAESNYSLALKQMPDLADPAMNFHHQQVALTYRYRLEKEWGDIYFQQANYVEAEKHYQQAYLANTSDFTLYKNIADTYYLRQDFTKAVYYNELGFKRSPYDYAWPLAISLSYQAAGDGVKALESLNQAIKLAPNNPDLEALHQTYLK